MSYRIEISRAAVLATALTLGGCAFEAGQPFALVEPSLSASWSRVPDREAPGGFEKLSSDYQVHITRAELALDSLVLRADTATAAGFNPASPPPGYGLCHGGHCHRDDGALVSYEEIEAELRGGGAGSTTVLVIPLEPADLLADQTKTLSCPEGCELPLGGASRIELRASRLRIEGRVRDGRSTPRIPQRGFRLELALPADAAPTFAAPVTLPADREAAPKVRLELTLLLTARLFDTVDWASAAEAGADLDPAPSDDEASIASLISQLAAAELQAFITRTEL